MHFVFYDLYHRNDRYVYIIRFTLDLFRNSYSLVPNLFFFYTRIIGKYPLDIYDLLFLTHNTVRYTVLYITAANTFFYVSTPLRSDVYYAYMKLHKNIILCSLLVIFNCTKEASTK